MEASETAASRDSKSNLPAPGRFVAVFALLAMAVLLTGYFYYQAHARQFRAEVAKQLSAIADLKLSEITQWRSERLEDGVAFLDNESFAELVQAHLKHPDDPQLNRRLTTWLQHVRDVSNYDRVFLVDASGTEIAASLSSPQALATQEKAMIAERLRTRRRDI